MKQRVPDALEFREICRREFRYLFVDYGFTELPQSSDPFLVSFENVATRITIIGRSFGYSLDVYVDRAGAESHPDRDEFMGWEVRDLLAQRKVRLPIIGSGGLGWTVWLVSLFLPWKPFRLQHDQRLQIPVYAERLREAAPDILRGDLAALPARRRRPAPDNLRAFGYSSAIFGLALAAWELVPRARSGNLLTQPNRWAIGSVPLIVAGVILIAVDAYRARNARQ